LSWVFAYGALLLVQHWTHRFALLSVRSHRTQRESALRRFAQLSASVLWSRGTAGKFHFHLKAPNGEIIAAS
jgi:hypothetical protein